jgi:small-conductance mechanosensitive channel
VIALGCRAMPASTVRLPLADFWTDNADVITAVLSIVLALLVATLLDRWFSRRGHKFAEAVTRGQVSPVLDTRLRFIRRLLYASILLIGLAVAASQFTGLSNLAKSILASGALAAAIIGFAARQTLANVVAGIMLAITQPLRVGDWVTFEEQYGVVEDVRLNYTVLRTPGDVRVVIPNERLAAGILRNDTLGSDRIALDVSVWLAPAADVGRALAALADATGSRATVAEVTPDGVRIEIAGDPVPPPERGPRQAELRALCLARLRSEGLLEQGIDRS